MKRLLSMLLLAVALLFGANQASALVLGGPGFYVNVPPHVYVGPPYPGYWPPYGPPYYGPPYYGPPYPGPGITIGVPVTPRYTYPYRYSYRHRVR